MFLFQVTSLSGSLAEAQHKLATAERAQRDAEKRAASAEAAAEKRIAAAEAAVKAVERRTASEKEASKSELKAVQHTARWGSGCAKIEAEMRLAKLGAAEAARKQRRLTAKLQVAETEVGLLLAERSLAQAQQTVAEEVAVAAVAACGERAAASIHFHSLCFFFPHLFQPTVAH